MPGKWILKVEGEPDKPGAYSIHLGWEDSKAGQFVQLIPPCKSVEAFQQDLERLMGELQQLGAEVRSKVESLARTRTKMAELNPATVWKEMESIATEAEMFRYFNDLDEPQRQRLAEYIFSNVNMFKGRGPVFSEHYDSTSHILE